MFSSYSIITLVFVNLLSKRQGQEKVEEDVAGEREQDYVSPVDLEDQGCSCNCCYDAYECNSDSIIRRVSLEFKREHRDLTYKQKRKHYRCNQNDCLAM